MLAPAVTSDANASVLQARKIHIHHVTIWLSQVEQYGEEYQDQSWGPLIALVKDNRPPPSRIVSSAKDRGAIKELFLTLNGYIQVWLTHAWHCRETRMLLLKQIR